jgi:hypothetical protein
VAGSSEIVGVNAKRENKSALARLPTSQLACKM